MDFMNFTLRLLLGGISAKKMIKNLGMAEISWQESQSMCVWWVHTATWLSICYKSHNKHAKIGYVKVV